MSLGIFDAFFDGYPNHLPLMNLHIDLSSTDTSLYKSLMLIDKIISENSSEAIFNDNKLMLLNPNWRLHLVSFFTILKSTKPQQKKYIKLLWKTLCIGTWVSPQLLVTLSKVDSDFKEKSDVILNDGSLEKFRTLYLNEDELLKNKFNPNFLNHKVLNALRYLNDRDVLKGVDDDNGAQIARRWNERLDKLNGMKLI